MDESDNFNHFPKSVCDYIYYFAYYYVLLFQKFFNGLGHCTLYTFQKISFFELQQVFHRCK